LHPKHKHEDLPSLKIGMEIKRKVCMQNNHAIFKNHEYEFIVHHKTNKKKRHSYTLIALKLKRCDKHLNRVHAKSKVMRSLKKNCS
jgi:hypothetical protein